MPSKYSDVDSFRADLLPWQQKQLDVVRRLVFAAVPEVVESIKYTVPFYTYKGLFLCIGPYKKTQFVINFCNGYLMADEAGMLNNDAGQTQIRHWRLDEHQKIDEDILLQYIHEARLISEYLWEQKRKKKR